PAGRHMKLQSSPVKQLALSRNVPCLTPENAKDKATLEWVTNLKADSAVVVAYGQILSKDFLALFPKHAVNVHASLLPRWRGAAPIQRSIMEGDRETGVSLQVVVPKLDAGPLLGERKISIDEETTSYDLYMKLRALAPELLAREYTEYLLGKRQPREQDETSVTVARKIAKDEGLIDWALQAREIHRKLRGLWMWPGSWTVRGGKTLKIWKSEPVEGGARPGEAVAVAGESLTIGCGGGALRIFEVQPESRAKMPVSEYLKGYPVRMGEKFG
ncbi:MAG: methionyl-tRNA formyltransferase, partial [Bdellovibrionia bacterium]